MADWPWGPVPPQDEDGDYSTRLPFPSTRTIPEAVPKKTKEENDGEQGS